MINSNLTSFQTGVDTIYNKCVSYGVTPTAKTPDAIITAIENVYNAGITAGKSQSGSNSIKVYLMATEQSSTNLGQGVYYTLTKNKVAGSITWGSACASTKCPQNSTYGAMLWITSWT